MTSWSSGRVPPDSRPRCTAPPKGCETLLLDRHGPGGQAGSSSRIENYLGFPDGVSGSDLARRAINAGPAARRRVSRAARGDGRLDRRRVQAPRARRWTAARHANHARRDGHGLSRASRPRRGGAHRRGRLLRRDHHRGAGVPRAKRVLVVGGGNSAGQGAMHLARYAADVQIVVRREGLAETMSRYLIEQIDETPNIRLRPRTEVASRRRRRARRAGDAPVRGRRIVPNRGGRRGLRLHRHAPATATGCRQPCCATRRDLS